MGFIRKAAGAGLFGLAGLAAKGILKKKSSDPKTNSSLVTGDYNSTTPSLVNQKSLY